MKKLIVGIIFVGLFISTPAFAYTLIDGKPVFGYVSGVKPEPGPEQAYVEKTTPTIVQFKPSIFGNTTIYDLMQRLTSEDQIVFLNLIKRAKISF